MKARTQWEKARLPAYASMANPYGGVEVMRPAGEADLEDGSLFERVLSRENMARAWAQVRRNKGAPGVDGLSIADFPDATRPLWPEILTSLRAGRYRPQPVRRVDIPKGNGGTRPLGIPTVLDRLIQQALAQVLVPIFDPAFSPWSYGFRPGRSAHDAVRHIADGIRKEGRSWAVDIDLSKFFDRVQHDMLMNRVARKVTDRRVLHLIGLYLRSGVMDGGVLQPTREGVPQGGPLSPLLANIMLDDLDRAVTARGHWFARYADDFVILLSSRAAAERVMASIRRFIERDLRLQVNEEKSRVVPATQATFLGFTFGRKKIRWTAKTLQGFKAQVRLLTGRSRGISLQRRIVELNRYLRGWMGYFRLSEYFRPLDGLDAWIRRRIRMCMWKQWRFPRTRIARLRAMGVPEPDAISTGSSNKGYWRLAKTKASNRAMDLQWFTELGLLSIKDEWIAFHYPK